MANSKISALTSATTPLAGTETLPIVQSGATKQVSVANLTAGRAISATELTLSTGNLVIGTAGKGIDFSADPSAPGMTSELLDDYEEGTWTPEVVGTTTAGTATYVYQDGYYTKIGNTVSVTCQIAYSGHTGTGNLRINGLPFNSFSSTANAPVANGAITCDNLTFSNQLEVLVARNSTQITLTTISSGAVRASLPMDAAANLFVSIVYRV